MSLNGLNVDHISANLAAYESARTGFFLFTVSQEELGNLLRPTYTGDPSAATDANKYAASEAYEDIKLAVTKTDVPHYSVEKLQYRRGNDVINFAGVPTFNDGSLTIDDYVGLDTKSLLMAWLRLAYDPYTRKGGRMKDYKKTCHLIEYTQDYEEIRRWDLEGCFITGLSEDPFDRASDGKRQITATLVYDRAVMVMPEQIEG